MKHIRSIQEPDPGATVLWRVVADTSAGSEIMARLTSLEGQVAALTTATTLVAARIWRSTNQAIASGSSWADVSWSNAAYEAGANFWDSGATVTIPSTGYYQLFAEATLDASGLLATRTGWMQLLADSTVIGEDEKTLTPDAKISLWCMAQRQFTAGAQIKVQVKHSDVMSMNMLSQGDHSPDLIIVKIG